jgi:hypothetical protein
VDNNTKLPAYIEDKVLKSAAKNGRLGDLDKKPLAKAMFGLYRNKVDQDAFDKE